jgi:hypothetical protein
MKAEQLLEHAPGILPGQDSCLSGPEPDLVRQASGRHYDWQQDRGR